MSFVLSMCVIAAAVLVASSEAQTTNNLARGAAGVVYGSAGADGVVVLNATDASVLERISLPSGFDGIHDVAVDGDLLFVLDGRGGSVGVFTIAGADQKPTFVTGSREEVSVGPYAGVSAGGGKMVVSGGTGSMSIFSYSSAGALTVLTNSVDLGTGQPDVLVDSDGSYAYVSTDFSGRVDGSGFGITTVDLNSNDLSDPSIERVGLSGAGFTDGVSTPANFPIESAISGNRLLVAHGGGLSILSLADRAKPSLTRTLDLDFGGVNVDADGDSAVVVGGDSAPRAARVNLSTNSVENVELSRGTKTASSVAVTGEAFIATAGDALIACNGDCSKSEPSGASASSDNSSDDNDVCVEEAYLFSRGIRQEKFLHNSGYANVLCPDNELPCGTENHVVRFGSDYLTYKELCISLKVTCTKDRKIVNGVSMWHARMLCADSDEHCVVPHVMRTGLEIERTVIRALHSSIVA